MPRSASGGFPYFHGLSLVVFLTLRACVWWFFLTFTAYLSLVVFLTSTTYLWWFSLPSRPISGGFPYLLRLISDGFPYLHGLRLVVFLTFTGYLSLVVFLTFTALVVFLTSTAYLWWFSIPPRLISGGFSYLLSLSLFPDLHG